MEPLDSKLRILFVPDSTYWITGRIAYQIAEYNPWIEPTICSAPVLRKLIKASGGVYPGDIDQVHFLTPHIATEFISTFREGIPCVTTIHHVEDQRSVEAEPLADAVMTVCKQWHDYLISSGMSSEKLVIVPNGVRTNAFRPPAVDEKKRLRQRLGLPIDSIVVGFSAKRTSDSFNRKDIETLASAMGGVSRLRQNTAFVIIGPGWDEFVNDQRQRGVRCVYFPFIVDHEDVAEVYRALDVYWVTARIEGGPVPLLEAMSTGIACITTPVGVALEIVRDGENALLSQIGDADGFVRQTDLLARTPEMRRTVGKAARDSVMQFFQCSQTTKNARRLYQVAATGFRKRNPSSPIRDVPTSQNGLREKSGFLNSVPLHLRARLAAEEHLEFMQALVCMGAHGPAWRVGFRAVRERPLDCKVWRIVIKASPGGPAYRALARMYRRVKTFTERSLRLAIRMLLAI